jgi:SAM-dependent methyltransferase
MFDFTRKRKLEELRDQGLWNGSCTTAEITFHQLSPYIGKLKSGIVESLISEFSAPGASVCDPFCGSGVVPLQAVIQGRTAFANDLSRYAWVLTMGKLSAPRTVAEAASRVAALNAFVATRAAEVDLRSVPSWVRSFFHPKTLRETITAFRYSEKKRDYFLMACLCGILHHQRPGFLSYPSSHTVPYLRSNLFPAIEYPDLYAYREVSSRLIAKVERAYRRPPTTAALEAARYSVRLGNAKRLPLSDGEIDLVLTSPPYFGALDYARDNRLRLWFLGIRDWSALDKKLTKDGKDYEHQMRKCLKEMFRVLKPGGHCVLIVGEVQANGKTKDTGAILGKMAQEVSGGGFGLTCFIEDEIPEARRSRRGTRTTRIEKVVVLEKRKTLIPGGQLG